jgi:WD40 repeat protein
MYDSRALEVQLSKVWDVGSGECVKTLSGHSESVLSVSFSPDGSLLASGSSDETVKVWNVGSGECVKTLSGHSVCVVCLFSGWKSSCI